MVFRITPFFFSNFEDSFFDGFYILLGFPGGLEPFIYLFKSN